MQNTSKELKKLAALATSDEVMCFRINDTIASLETAVERSYTIFAGISPPLFQYWDNNESTEDRANWEWEEILDRCMN
jgi:hypothetical protein